MRDKIILWTGTYEQALMFAKVLGLKRDEWLYTRRGNIVGRIRPLVLRGYGWYKNENGKEIEDYLNARGAIIVDTVHT